MSRTDLKRLARNRDDFLSSGELGHLTLVDAAIQASWLRSRQMSVDVQKVNPTYLSQFNEETPLAISATPVLRQLSDELANEPIGIILTDANGLVLQRLASGTSLTRAMDNARLGPGFNYAEEFVGTNGIGTALERRAPTLVDGFEHYTHDLGAFSCAGAPILHPISGALLGILDLTSLAKDSNPLLLVIAKSTAHRIQQQLLSQANARELALFADYLTASKRGADCVLALGEDLIVLSAHTERYFDADDQAALLARSADAEGFLQPTTLLADLPSGLTARMEYRPVFAGHGLAGGVFRIHRNTAPDPSVASSRAVIAFPGVVGISAIWQQTCRAIDASHRRREWLVLEGEAGVGKLALLRGVHQLRTPSAHFRVIDAADAADPEAWLDTVSEELAGEGGTLVLRRVHLLGSQAIRELSALLLEASAVPESVDRPWVAMTMCTDPRSPQVDAQLLPHFPHTIEVPPLRRHMDDLRSLVYQLLGRIHQDSTVTVSLAAMDQLKRLPWRGNIEYLRRVLVQIARLRRTGNITVDDLPAECRATSRRQLTQMETLERDAIATSLVDHRGNKDRAAEDLGMSRSTIYRKIRDYGITWAPDHSDLA